MSDVKVGKIHKEGNDFELALAAPSPDGNGLKVVSFPEPGGVYVITNNAIQGHGPGEFDPE